MQHELTKRSPSDQSLAADRGRLFHKLKLEISDTKYLNKVYCLDELRGKKVRVSLKIS